MITEIKNETQKALTALSKSNLSHRRKDLLRQMTNEIQQAMDSGDWDMAVRLSFYRHEFAKSFKFLDWYNPFVQIRKARDQIKILVEEFNVSRKRNQETSYYSW